MARTFEGTVVKELLDEVFDEYLRRKTQEFYLFASGAGRAEETDLPVLSGKCAACRELKSQIYTGFGFEKEAG